MNMLKLAFINANGRLRNGWWILIFIGVVALTRLAFKPVMDALRSTGVPDSMLEPVPFMFLLFATWVCLRLRREPLSSVGFRLDRRWFREFGIGTGLGIAAIGLTVGLIWLFGGVSLQLDPARSLQTLGYGLYMFLFVALLEELLFRGFIFQRLLDGTGTWIALSLTAVLFAVAHWTNPGMEGVTKIIATLDIALAAIFLGLAFIKTRSLALPVGMHLGWNWAQGHVMGFGVSGLGMPGWFQPEFLGRPTWLTGGEFGPEASVFAILIECLTILLILKWKGLHADTTNSPARVRPLCD